MTAASLVNFLYISIFAAVVHFDNNLSRKRTVARTHVDRSALAVPFRVTVSSGCLCFHAPSKNSSNRPFGPCIRPAVSFALSFLYMFLRPFCSYLSRPYSLDFAPSARRYRYGHSRRIDLPLSFGPPVLYHCVFISNIRPACFKRRNKPFDLEGTFSSPYRLLQ